MAWVLPAGKAIALIALGQPTSVPAGVDVFAQLQAREGLVALTDAEVAQRLTGHPRPGLASLATLRASLQRADEREARFDTRGATVLRRQVIDAFDRSPLHMPELTRLAARAYIDTAAGFLTEGMRNTAMATLQEGLRRFPGAAIDPIRHPPSVQALYQAAGVAVRRASHGMLRVYGDVSGRIFADGRNLGAVADGRVEQSVPVGAYRVWLQASAGGWSLPYAVQVVQGETREVHVAWQLDQRIHLGSPLSVACAGCDADLALLGMRLGVFRVFGLRAAQDEGVVDVLTVDVGSRMSSQSMFVPQKQLPTIVLPIWQGMDGSPAWIGYVLADMLANRLFGHTHIDVASRRRFYPPDVVTWEDLVARDAHTSAGTARASDQDTLRRLAADAGGIALGGTYDVRADKITLHAHAMGEREGHGMTSVPWRSLSAAPERVFQQLALATSLAEDPLAGHPWPVVATEVLETYGRGLETQAQTEAQWAAGETVSPALLFAAHALYVQACAANPTFAQAWARRGYVSALLGHGAMAEKEFAEALGASGEVWPLVGRGLFAMYRTQGDMHSAVDVLHQTVLQHPGFVGGRALLRRARGEPE